MDNATQKELLELVKHNYDEIADDFSETRKKDLWPELLKLTADVRDGDKVLDVGCGNGRLLEAFKDKQIEYVGMDSSEKLIEIAKNSEFGIRNSEFILGDILEMGKLPYSNFDYIFCIAVLHHIPGVDLRVKALEQMKAKLAPGGRIVMTNWNLWSQAKFRPMLFKQALRKVAGPDKYDFGDLVFKGFKQGSERYYHTFTMRELRQVAALAGLEAERLYKDKFNYYTVLRK